jgi:hypothetical protein
LKHQTTTQFSPTILCNRYRRSCRRFLTFDHPGTIIAVLGDVGACLGWMHIDTTSINQVFALRLCFPVEFRSPNSQRSIDSSDIYLHHLLYQVYLIDRSHSVLYLFFQITYCEKFLIPSSSQHDALKLHIRYCHFDCPCLASADRFRGRSHRHKVSRHINVSSSQPSTSLEFP